MKILIVGAGPTGLFTAIALARRGYDVVVADRDPGPPRVGEWRRRGVMQFRHAHSFRGQVVDSLSAEIPDLLAALTSAGATVVPAPHDPSRAAALHCRRSVFEAALRRCAEGEPRIRMITGHVDEIVARRHRVVGARIGGHDIDADLVINASGRTSRVGTQWRGPGERTDCGATYVGRRYRLRDHVDPGQTNSVIGLSLAFPQYAAIVFQHDDRTFTATVIHSGDDEGLHRLRHNAVFDAAMSAIPGVADWIHPERAVPLTPILPGGRIYNSYRGQFGDAGEFVTGFVSVGDAVCTTTPLAGRGVTLALMQARELVRLLSEDDRDIAGVATTFDQWCTDNVRPWFIDHRYTDTERVRRWSGYDVALERPLPSDLIVAAAQADPRLDEIVAPYVTMDALPASLTPAEPRAHAIFAGGWRPTPPPGPTLDELISVVSATPEAA